MSATLNIEAKSVLLTCSAKSAFQHFKAVMSCALLISVSMLGLGSTSALAQIRQPAVTLESQPAASPAKLRTLPGMGAGEKAQPQTGTLNYPYGMAVDTAGNLYVANVFGGVNIYSSKGFKHTNTLTAGLNYPAAVALSYSGNIYVANNGGDNITIYNPALSQIGAITDPTLYSPDSMYIDANDDIWALDAAGVLHLYLDNGAAAGSAATGGTAVGPWGPYVTVWGVANGPGSYSEVFQNVGETLHYGPTLQNDFVGGSPEAGGEAEDSLGQQYVSDINTNHIQIWSSNGLYEVGAITTPATPFGLAVDSVRKRIFVSLTTSNEVLVYSTAAPYKLLATIK